MGCVWLKLDGKILTGACELQRKHGWWKDLEMFSDKSTLRQLRVAAFGILVWSVPALAKDEFSVQKTFDGSVNRVYAAEVQAVGPTLKNAVKEACLVNFETGEVHPNNYGGFYRTIFWTATCHDAGNGKTTVTLSVQVKSNMFGNGRAEKKDADKFWSNMDAALNSLHDEDTHPAISPTQATQADVAIVQITSEPSAAEITVDGNYAGSTPSQLRLKSGSHSFKITEKGFTPWERSISVEAGESRTIAAQLQKLGQ
jgi:hypothetical protein